jgi:hypothetical protein
VRFEKTDDLGEGPLNDIRATYRQDANGNLLRDAAGRLIPVTTDALATAKLRYVERGATTERSYSGYYPSINGTYYLTEALVARSPMPRPSAGPRWRISSPASRSRTRARRCARRPS